MIIVDVDNLSTIGNIAIITLTDQVFRPRSYSVSLLFCLKRLILIDSAGGTGLYQAVPILTFFPNTLQEQLMFYCFLLFQILSIEIDYVRSRISCQGNQRSF